jgi:hypothetical protein
MTTPTDISTSPRNPVARHPWILVVLAFLLLLTAWGTLITLSARVPNQKLDPIEEGRLLEAGRVQP